MKVIFRVGPLESIDVRCVTSYMSYMSQMDLEVLIVLMHTFYQGIVFVLFRVVIVHSEEGATPKYMNVLIFTYFKHLPYYNMSRRLLFSQLFQLILISIMLKTL